MPETRLIPIDQPELWNAIVRRCQSHDVYHLAEYQRAATPTDAGVAVLAVVEDHETEFVAALPLRLRPVTDIPAVRASGLVSDAIMDAVSPYGYPGLITSATPGGSPDVAAGLDALFRRHSVVSAFIRQHPLMSTTSCFTGPFRADAIGLTVSIDLTLHDDAYSRQTRKSHRADIASWASRGAVFEELDRRDVARFGQAYRQTMKRKGAHERYLFDDSYFATLALELGDSCRLFSARNSSTPVGASDAMAVVLTCGSLANYHLAATSAEPEFSGLSRWLLEMIRRKLKGEDFSSLLLGGGVGASGDSLFQFKSGFSKVHPPFDVVRWIGDAAIFEQLCNITSAPRDSDFFPPYRSTRRAT